MRSKLWQMGVVDLAGAIRTGQVSSREVIQAHLDRIQEVNPDLNAVTVVLEEEALRASDEADRRRTGSKSLGPLHGVPMTVKENIDLAGSPTTQGVLALKDAVPAEDAPHVSQLKQAGAIPIARTNMPDFGLRWHTENALRGATRNPWDRSRTPGGSSGGDAVALATGMTPLGLGNDYGGSLRFPSQCCGTTAIRPTLGRVAWAASGAPFEFPITVQLFAVQGPMARQVCDLKLVLASMCGTSTRDPWWCPVPLAGPAMEEPVRVALVVDPGKAGVASSVSAGVRRAAKALEAVGYVVEEAEPPGINEAAHLWLGLLRADLKGTFLPLVREMGSTAAREFLEDALSLAPEPDLDRYIKALADRNRLAREWAQFASTYPLILGPVSTEPPFPVGYDRAGKEAVGEMLHSLRLVVAVNLLGLPAVAVPAGVEDGLPQGVQVIGARFREDLCLDAAQAIEEANGLRMPIKPEA